MAGRGAIYAKPPTCIGCPLYEKGLGFQPLPDGPLNAPIAFIGEALGEDEARIGKPFVGASGKLLDGLLRKVGLGREQILVDNTIRCRPPNNWLVGAPWEAGAIAHCSQYLDDTILKMEGGVLVGLGVTASRRLLGLPKKGFKLDNWHGSPVVRSDGKVVVATYHPSYLIQGNQNMTGVVCWDIKQAIKVASQGYQRDVANLVVDPPIEWLTQWATKYNPSSDWLAVDIETLDKENADEDELEDSSYQITRINFSYNPNEGITIPWGGQYLDIAKKLLQAGGLQCYWNARYDIPRLKAADCEPKGLLLDFMWGFHILQSNIRTGLGFVSPFYSSYGPWKHLNATDPGTYAAIDSIQTLRCSFGIAKDLKASYQWDSFFRHVYELDSKVLWPLEEVGLGVDDTELRLYQQELKSEAEEAKQAIQTLVPPDALPLHPRGGWKRKPKAVAEGDLLVSDDDGKTTIPYLGYQGGGSPTLRYFIRDDFNPASPQQVMEYVRLRGWSPGKAKKTLKDSVDVKTMESLAKKTKDPIFPLILKYRKITKIEGTYVEGTLKRLVRDNTLNSNWNGISSRLHATFSHRPSTLRLSCQNPNLQNIDKESNYRKAIVAASDCTLVEADKAAVEAVQVGWYCGDPDYIRLAKLGVHAYLCSHMIKQSADLKWSDEDLEQHFRMIKKRYPDDYFKAKKIVHSTNYLMSSYGIAKEFPEIFTKAAADKLQAMYFELCPKLKQWQMATLNRAHRQGYLGGNDHPYHYKHWFWDVLDYSTGRMRLGKDSKKTLAFYPQSTASGDLKDDALELMSEGSPYFIGDLYHGKTPMRALIHDSILLEVPKIHLDKALEALQIVMTRGIKEQPCPEEWGIGPNLSIGVEIKVGKNWKEMETVVVAKGVSGDDEDPYRWEED